MAARPLRTGRRSAGALLLALAAAVSVGACGSVASGTPGSVTGLSVTGLPATTTTGTVTGLSAFTAAGMVTVPSAHSSTSASSLSGSSRPGAVTTAVTTTAAGPTATAPTAATPTPVTTPAATRAAPRTTGPAAAFHSSISRIDDALADRMKSSYHPGCPVALAELRYLRLSYWGFDGRPHTGELVVSARVAQDVVTAFRSLYAHRFAIRQMRLVDDFAGSDDASMAADNTSAFNCRPVTGGSGWSEHSYGEAIDINPIQNPYLSGSTVLPPAGKAYLDRPDQPGVIHAGDAAVRAFAAIGWTWGGTWTSPVDLQHFSRSGR